MDITIRQLGKKFRKEWIFKNFDYSFKSGNRYAITGPNGIGKSTLLQIISGFMPSTSGEVIYYSENNAVIHNDQIYRYIAFSGPYLELIEEFTLKEMIKFHFKFKNPVNKFGLEELVNKMSLTDAINKPIKAFSSGMKQRLKLGLVFFSEVPVLLLDEPTTNLDDFGVKWYINEINLLPKNRLILVSSNLKREYSFCNKVLDLEHYKLNRF